MTDIYEQHAAAFSKVSAFVILDLEGERVATVALKHPSDGAGRLYAYVHLIGVEMVRAHANGYGYDKRSAAVAAAIAKIKEPEGRSERDLQVSGYHELITDAAPAMDSRDWTQAIEAAGFRVLQAV